MTHHIHTDPILPGTFVVTLNPGGGLKSSHHMLPRVDATRSLYFSFFSGLHILVRCMSHVSEYYAATHEGVLNVRLCCSDDY